MKCSPKSPFAIATSTIPISDKLIPTTFRMLIFSLKKAMPAPIEKIGIVAMTIALMVGEPVSFRPNVSHMKYMKGSKNARSRNFPRSCFCILLILA